jgi:hypothetical protein
MFSKLALNIGCNFMTPEACFLGEKDVLPKIDFNPRNIFKTNGSLFKGKTNPKIKSDGKESKIFMLTIQYVSDYFRWITWFRKIYILEKSSF